MPPHQRLRFADSRLVQVFLCLRKAEPIFLLTPFIKLLGLCQCRPFQVKHKWLLEEGGRRGQKCCAKPLAAFWAHLLCAAAMRGEASEREQGLFRGCTPVTAFP